MGSITTRIGRGALLAALLAGTALAGPALAQHPATSDPVAAGFADPSNSARPRVWWHWMNGNVTKDGITKDIEWMSRVGIGGLQTFDVDLLTPKVVDQRLVYMSPEWKDAFRHAATVADQKGLELAIASSPGWSETGGPWVKPEDGMKKLVWSETLLTGGRRFQGRLAEPPRTTGRFGDAGLEASVLGPPDPNPPQLYRDAAVVAYRLSDQATPLPPARITVAGAPLDVAVFTDSSLKSGVQVPRGTAAEPGAIVVEYPKPVTIRSLALALSENTSVFGTGGAGVKPRLEAQDARGAWSPVADVDLAGAPQTTIAFAPVTSQRFRIVFTPFSNPDNFLPPGAPGAQTIGFAPAAPRPTIGVQELRLSSEARVNRVEVKAGFGVVPSYYALDGGLADEAGVVPRSVVDLTSRMRPDGQLDWTPPAGRWKVLRLGYSLTGTTNHPTTKEASGLEVDKMDGAAVRRYVETYLAMYADATGPDLMGRKGLQALLTDSIEVGAANWTPQILEQFQRLRGYDPHPWLPVLTGAVIGSRAESEAFLYDWRRTLADLLTSQHYETVAKVAHERGLRVYGEALEDRRPLIGDDLAMRRFADIPMAALWTYPADRGPRPSYVGDMRGAASVAHVYGQNVVAAESLTAAQAPWAFAPRDLKSFIDLEFVTGVNRPVIHTSVHQPLDDKQPGFSLFIFGQYFNRHESWAEMAKPWVDYMARSSFLLQQGRNHADVAYFVGEERPVTQLFTDGAVKDAPRTYAFDVVGPDMLLSQFTVDGGELTTRGGARYRALYLGGDSQRMTLPVLKRLAALAEAGATIVGRAPASSPSLADDKAEFDTLVRRLWGGGASTRVGGGQVIASGDVEQALSASGLGPDFAYDNPGDREVLFLHRSLPDAEVYFLSNRKDRAESFEGRFRVAGKAPEVWRADTGAAEPVSYRTDGGETRVALEMLPNDAFFVVFRKPAQAPSAVVAKTAWRPAQTLGGAWDVTFQPGRGAPASARFETLASLSESADPGVKYFSGVATYTTNFRAPKVGKGRQVLLDLGQIADVAEVSVNGVPVGAAWKAPYRVDVTKALRPGANRLEVRVANLWVNRLIGDQQPGAKKVTFTTAPTYKPDAPLRPSGLIGPVALLVAE